MPASKSDLVRVRYEKLIRSRDRHDQYAQQAMIDQDYPSAFRHRKMFLREQGRVVDLLVENATEVSTLPSQMTLDGDPRNGTMALFGSIREGGED